MSSLVRIVADEPVRYSLDNGISVMEYTPGEVYQVPDWAGANMVRRGWAKKVKVEDLKDESKNEAEPPEVDLLALRKVDDKRKRKQED